MKNIYIANTLAIMFLNTFLICVSLVMLSEIYNKEEKAQSHSKAPLYLTKYLNNGNNKYEAQRLAKVHHEKFFNIESYSGYFTINESTNSHTFFWYFPSVTTPSDAPLIVWLNGGPGTSSMYSLFLENGPFEILSSTEIKMRKYSLHKHYNLLYFDNPIGTGFSITTNGYATNQKEIGRDLYGALSQFYQLFPDFANRKLYLGGESYAGKFILALAHIIHTSNSQTKPPLNLKGLIIGNGYIDPINQINFADYLYNLGLIDSHEALILKIAQNECINLINQEKYFDASRMLSDIIIGNPEFTPFGSLLSNFTGFSNKFNYLKADDDDIYGKKMESFLNQKDIQRAIHVGEMQFFSHSSKAERQLFEEMSESVAPWMSTLLSHYRVIVYTGDEIYKTAKRHKWYCESELAGYYKIAGNLIEVMVRNAGHMVTRDQPKWAYALLNAFVNDEEFH